MAAPVHADPSQTREKMRPTAVMSFISYAQNFEDVMLWRALKHVANGRYIDIGAQHPVIDSVSKAFYEAGWRGIHVEPVPEYAALLREDRPDEVVLQAAMSDRAGMLELNIFPETGLSTGVKEFAERHEAAQGLQYRRVQVPMLPMRDALASLTGQEVHWLKIDVEGLEEAVLRGWDSQALRPWIIIVEATVPMSTEVNYKGAEDIIINSGYKFCYFDGLNRFYVADEHHELSSAFELPPNVFDAARLSGLASSELCREILDRHRENEEKWRAKLAERELELLDINAAHERRLTAAEAMNEALQAEHDAVLSQHDTLHSQYDVLRVQLSQAEMQVAQVQAELLAIQGQLAATLRSTSWRISAPVRFIGAPFRRLISAAREGRLRSGLRRRAKAVLRAGAAELARWPMLKRVAVKLLTRSPVLASRVRAITNPPRDEVVKLHLELSRPARDVLVALQANMRD